MTFYAGKRRRDENYATKRVKRKKNFEVKILTKLPEIRTSRWEILSPYYHMKEYQDYDTDIEETVSNDHFALYLPKEKDGSLYKLIIYNHTSNDVSAQVTIDGKGILDEYNEKNHVVDKNNTTEISRQKFSNREEEETSTKLLQFEFLNEDRSFNRKRNYHLGHLEPEDEVFIKNMARVKVEFYSMEFEGRYKKPMEQLIDVVPEKEMVRMEKKMKELPFQHLKKKGVGTHFIPESTKRLDMRKVQDVNQWVVGDKIAGFVIHVCNKLNLAKLSNRYNFSVPELDEETVVTIDLTNSNDPECINWETEEVVEFINKINTSRKWGDAFQEGGITGDVLGDLDEDTLDDQMEINVAMDRMKILNSIKRLLDRE